MNSDFHIHTSFSGDSDTPMTQMIERGIELGLKTMCFTDHIDWDYPNTQETEPIVFDFNIKTYLETIQKQKENYSDKIEILAGVEIGLQPHLAKKYQEMSQKYPFDFIIGSSHTVNGADPYYPAFFEGRSEEEAYMEYFQSILDNVQAYTDYSVYGHLDYVVRYGPNRQTNYTIERYSFILDKILKKLIEKGIGIELNTAGYKYGLGFANPHPRVIKRYRELGGEIITVGSDGHKPEYLAYDFAKVNSLLKESGFRYYTEFRQRKPYFKKL